MLPIEERLKLLEESLSKRTPDELYEELKSYEAIGPTCEEYFESVNKGLPSDLGYLKEILEQRVYYAMALTELLTRGSVESGTHT